MEGFCEKYFRQAVGDGFWGSCQSRGVVCAWVGHRMGLVLPVHRMGWGHGCSFKEPGEKQHSLAADFIQELRHHYRPPEPLITAGGDWLICRRP